jgi:ribosomal protein S8
MTMTDPIADMLTRLRNANQAYHDTTSMPHSKIKVGIADILTAQGYIAGYEVIEPGEGEVGKTLKLTLKYGNSRSVRSQASAGSPSRASACTPSPRRCRRCWAAWASRSSPPPRVC